MNKFDKAIHDLICSSLREGHFEKFSAEELRVFNYKLGAALHNLPHYLSTMGELPLSVYYEINLLDPTTDDKTWGDWVTRFARTIEQELPEDPLYIFSQA